MTKQNKKYIQYLLIAIIVIGAVYYFVSKSAKNVDIDVQSFSIMGQQHVQDVSSIKYNSNPPTSGSHLSSPVKAGFYTRQINDGNLLHNLEHGYVVINYDCTKEIKFDKVSRSLIPTVYAHEGHDGAEVENTNGPTVQAVNEDSFNTEECNQIKQELSDIIKNNNWKVIAQPRPENDHLISVTSWGRLMNLDSFNKSKIETFIRKYLNKGPEKTAQ